MDGQPQKTERSSKILWHSPFFTAFSADYFGKNVFYYHQEMMAMGSKYGRT
jgi:hypothetical protein